MSWNIHQVSWQQNKVSTTKEHVSISLCIHQPVSQVLDQPPLWERKTSILTPGQVQNIDVDTEIARIFSTSKGQFFFKRIFLPGSSTWIEIAGFTFVWSLPTLKKKINFSFFCKNGVHNCQNILYKDSNHKKGTNIEYGTHT